MIEALYPLPVELSPDTPHTYVWCSQTPRIAYRWNMTLLDLNEGLPHTGNPMGNHLSSRSDQPARPTTNIRGGAESIANHGLGHLGID